MVMSQFSIRRGPWEKWGVPSEARSFCSFHHRLVIHSFNKPPLSCCSDEALGLGGQLSQAAVRGGVRQPGDRCPPGTGSAMENKVEKCSQAREGQLLGGEVRARLSEGAQHSGLVLSLPWGVTSSLQPQGLCTCSFLCAFRWQDKCLGYCLPPIKTRGDSEAQLGGGRAGTHRSLYQRL